MPSCFISFFQDRVSLCAPGVLEFTHSVLKWKVRVLWKVVWMMFCWDKHMKEGFVTVDTGERLRQTREEHCAEADTGERKLC